MEYQQCMFKYALNGDNTVHGIPSPLSGTSVGYDYCITQNTGYTSTKSVSLSCEADNRTNTGIDIRKTHNVPQRKIF